MDVQWLDGQASVPGVVEKICPMRHIRQNQWRSEWNNMYLGNCCYDYISDYECVFNHSIDPNTKQIYIDYIDPIPARWATLQAAKQQGTKIPITNLAHFTNPIVAETIIESGGFLGGLKKINVDALGHDVKEILSWWSPIFTTDDITQVRRTLGGAITPFLGPGDDYNTLQDQFATSHAFLPNSFRYGTSFFQYDINYLCQQYRNQAGGEVQFKVLGTFGYKQEVMHAVLVCSQANGAGKFGAYPRVLTPEKDVNNEAVVTRDAFGNWVWKPQATGTEIRRLNGQRIYPLFRRWENVAFAFHITDICGNDPNKKQLMSVPQLGNNLHCLQPLNTPGTSGPCQ